jgi:hypothetical protein
VLAEYFFDAVHCLVFIRSNEFNLHIQKVGYGSVDYTELAQDRDRWQTLVNPVMNIRVP